MILSTSNTYDDIGIKGEDAVYFDDTFYANENANKLGMTTVAVDDKHISVRIEYWNIKLSC